MSKSDQVPSSPVDGDLIAGVFLTLLVNGDLDGQGALRMAEQVLASRALSDKKIMVSVEAVKLTGGDAFACPRLFPMLEYLLECANDGLPLDGAKTQYSRDAIVAMLGIGRCRELKSWYSHWAEDEDADTADFKVTVAHAEQRLSNAPELAWLSFELAGVLFDAGCGDRLDRDYARKCIAKAEGWWDHTVKHSKGHPSDLTVKALQNITEARKLQGKPCIIASTAAPSHAFVVEALRQARDRRIVADPVARDFFHVFWSRYYEWSPAVARVAAADKASADAIRWAFVEPWLAWMEVVTILGRQPSAASDADRQEALARLSTRVQSWCAELPERLESKRHEESAIWAAFEAFRAEAAIAFESTTSNADTD